ncbi:hypothetical protein EV356DRAFT_497014 [Viridothelium virens]|uniref:Uncharacterized protein n=1 Tax=Viridothelium virens TaxID=1048519 RepID=A0A6A6GTW2_VIRVR|nr:hypothetical protein EV356DRAFT_497014 [Viridothelium virens]
MPTCSLPSHAVEIDHRGSFEMYSLLSSRQRHRTQGCEIRHRAECYLLSPITLFTVIQFLSVLSLITLRTVARLAIG